MATLLSANLTNGLETKEEWQIDVPVLASEIIYEGAPVMIKAASSGYGYSPDNTTNVIAQGDIFVGYCLEKCDNGSGAAGAKFARVQSRGAVKLTFASVAQGDVGKAVYVNATTTDSTATITPDNSTTEVYVGYIVEYVDSTHALVMIASGSRAGQATNALNTAVGFHNLKVVKYTYDFSVVGGAVGTLTGPTLPINTVVLGAKIDITTTLTSGGSATIALSLEAANDIKTATAVASWAAGNLAPAAGATFGTATIKTTAARAITVTIGTAALTAGVFDLYLVVANA